MWVQVFRTGAIEGKYSRLLNERPVLVTVALTDRCADGINQIYGAEACGFVIKVIRVLLQTI